MPSIFKAVVSIAVWVLFIKGWIAALVGCTMSGVAVMGGGTPSMVYPVISLCGVAALALASVGAWLRRKLE